MTARRPAGPSESILLATHQVLGGSTQSVMVFALDEPLPVGSVMRGLRWLFLRHPMLRARLDGQAPHWDFVFDGRFEDVAVTTAGPAGPLEQMFAAECDHVLDLTTGPLWRVLLGRDATGRVDVILVTFAHAIVDGVSAFAFIRQLLAAATDTVEESVSLAPCPALEDGLRATPAPLGPTPTLPSWDGVTAWPFEKTVPFADRRTSIVLGRVESSTMAPLLARCRADKVKIDALFIAAAQLALARRHPVVAAVPLLGVFDARPAMTPVPSPDEIGMFAKDMQLFDPAWARDGADLWARAAGMSRLLVTARAAELAAPSGPPPDEVYRHITAADGAALTAFPASFSVSNMGRQSLAAAGLRTAYLSSTDRIGIMGVQIVLAELHGDVHIAFIHADPLVSQETVTLLRDDLVDILRRAEGARG